ncbi:MAG: hypothetical protein QN199_11395, partial [Armatimonadota bacterium]|nr:hypothetical protein [Armatimonadota bacterium]
MDERALRYLEAALDAAEQQFVALLSQHKLFLDNGAGSPAGRLVGDLRRVLAAVVELEGRRDVTFPNLDRLRTLRARAVWLYRRLVQERLFARKVQLEERLKSMISPEAYQVYLELQACE